MFFGTLQPREVEVRPVISSSPHLRPTCFYQRLYDQTWMFVTESLLAFTIFRDEFDVLVLLMFGFLLFVKCFHWLMADRVESVSTQASCLFPSPSDLQLPLEDGPISIPRSSHIIPCQDQRALCCFVGHRYHHVRLRCREHTQQRRWRYGSIRERSQFLPVCTQYNIADSNFSMLSCWPVHSTRCCGTPYLSWTSAEHVRTEARTLLHGRIRACTYIT